MFLKAKFLINQLSTTKRRCSLYFCYSWLSWPTLKVLPIMAISMLSRWIIMKKQHVQKTIWRSHSILASPREKLPWSVCYNMKVPIY